MGASESALATPSSRPLLNKHLAHVSDPRSPTAGILRTPIEVESSLQGSPLAGSKEEGLVDNDQNWNLDPRSPTPGILRTPMKAVVANTINNLVKQLSEAFAATAAEEEQLPEEPSHHDQKPEAAFVAKEGSREEASPGEASQREKERQEPLAERASLMAASRIVAKPAHALGPSGSKPVRCRASSKMLAVSTSSVRSPLSVLQDDNSPSSLASQGKRRSSVADHPGERKEGVLPSGRTLKAGSCGWGSSLNKENQQRHLVEN
ncbi:cell division cycle-associated protein 3 [Eublepharis macularius]|uniref:Cell division cycle-associated protein 3 n=1 Tax=Eublepharis macularius TaxID=481883 RepID=A0AA97KNE5_EUBMA|nr:cell division cycle-associated protein 3 [Eublepharis macularius]XP_054858476.1 cell division cycle-associated protein 3 [Eublepharis macularius]